MVVILEGGWMEENFGGGSGMELYAHILKIL